MSPGLTSPSDLNGAGASGGARGRLGHFSKNRRSRRMLPSPLRGPQRGRPRQERAAPVAAGKGACPCHNGDRPTCFERPTAKFPPSQVLKRDRRDPSESVRSAAAPSPGESVRGGSPRPGRSGLVASRGDGQPPPSLRSATRFVQSCKGVSDVPKLFLALCVLSLRSSAHRSKRQSPPSLHLPRLPLASLACRAEGRRPCERFGSAKL
jgi:hypothetical protein